MVVLVRILQVLGWIEPLAVPFKPLMGLVGLPAEMGIVWVTAMVNNLYGAIVVFVSLIREVPVTTAQATILATMMLIAHTLPVELRIAQKSGPRLLFQGLSRVGAALVLGGILHLIYTASGRLQGPATVIFTSDQHNCAGFGVMAAMGQGAGLEPLFHLSDRPGPFLSHASAQRAQGHRAHGPVPWPAPEAHGHRPQGLGHHRDRSHHWSCVRRVG